MYRAVALLFIQEGVDHLLPTIDELDLIQEAEDRWAAEDTQRGDENPSAQRIPSTRS